LCLSVSSLSRSSWQASHKKQITSHACHSSRSNRAASTSEARRTAVEPTGSAPELERHTKSLGTVPRHPVLASHNRVCPPLPSGSSKQLRKQKAPPDGS